MSLITVGISDLAVSCDDDVIVTYALGSCVGICLSDRRTRIGGLSHIMLPDSKQVHEDTTNPKKYADTAIYMMLKEMVRQGADVKSVTAKIVGGAQMFAATAGFNIGERNIMAVTQILNKYNIPIIAQQTGGSIGRTVFFKVKTNEVKVKSAMHGVTII